MSDQVPLIAHVVYHFGTGGMENGMVNLFNHLPPERFRHVVICQTGFGEFRKRITAQQVDFFDLGKQPGHDYRWMPRLFKLLDELRPDILHTRNLNALEAQFVGAFWGVKGRVHGEHGRDMYDLDGTNWKYNLMRRAARRVVHQYIAVSQDLAHWLKQTVHVPPEHLTQIYNGVDTEKFRPAQRAVPLPTSPACGGGASGKDTLPASEGGAPQADTLPASGEGRGGEKACPDPSPSQPPPRAGEEKWVAASPRAGEENWVAASPRAGEEKYVPASPRAGEEKCVPAAPLAPEIADFLRGATCVIGSVGRMAAVKNYPSLVQAFIRLCGQSSDPAGLRLIIVGGGPVRAECQALIDAAGLSRQAWFPGDRSDTPDWLRAFDVFVLPSLGEGISNTILEAMATGLPVVATRVGGTPELVVEGETGRMFTPGDVASLTQILAGYASDPLRSQREGLAARARIERRFSWPRAAAAYQAVYEGLL